MASAEHVRIRVSVRVRVELGALYGVARVAGHQRARTLATHRHPLLSQIDDALRDMVEDEGRRRSGQLKGGDAAIRCDCGPHGLGSRLRCRQTVFDWDAP